MNRKITMIWETGDGQMIDLTRDVPPAAKAMTDNELNALIAEKVMGRENVRDLGGRIVYDSPVMFNAKTGKISFAPTEVPDYANDIAAAWQILEHFRANGKGWRVQMGLDCKEWIVANSEDGLFLDGWTLEGGYIWESAPTVTRAICLAALEALKVNG